MKFILFSGVLCLLFANLTFGMEPLQILEKSDQQYIPDICTYFLTLTTISSDGKEDVTEYEGKKKLLNNLLIVKKPKRIEGQVYLKNRDVLWSYYPTIHQSIKVSYRAIFMGTVLSYGDILSLELSKDYEVKSMAETNEFYQLTLTPKEGQSGYAKILVWINKTNYLPVRREYYSLSGIIMKTCEFKNISYDEQKNISEISEEFYEPLKKRKTIVKFNKVIKLDNIADRIFNPINLKFFAGE
jgi:outer membrane lipoprotein-sorting protein